MIAEKSTYVCRCPVCDGESGHRKIRDYFSKAFSRKFEILECCACGTRRTYPFLTGEQLREYYGDEEIVGAGKYDKWQRKYRYIHDWIARHIDVAGKRVIEVGSNSGNLLRYFKERSHCDVTGIELSAAGKEYSETINDVPVSAGRLGEYRESSRTGSDLVLMVHLFEHITDPVTFLRDVRGILNEDGHVYIELPNARMIDFELTGDFANPYCMPFHAYLYHMESLTRLLKQNGFSVVAKRYWSRKEDGGSITKALADSYRYRLEKKFGSNVFSRVLAKAFKMIVRFYPHRFLIGFAFSKRNKSTTIAVLGRKAG